MAGSQARTTSRLVTIQLIGAQTTCEARDSSETAQRLRAESTLEPGSCQPNEFVFLCRDWDNTAVWRDGFAVACSLSV